MRLRVRRISPAMRTRPSHGWPQLHSPRAVLEQNAPEAKKRNHTAQDHAGPKKLTGPAVEIGAKSQQSTPHQDREHDPRNELPWRDGIGRHKREGPQRRIRAAPAMNWPMEQNGAG